MARRIAYTGEPVLTLDEVARQCRLDPEDMQAELIEQVIIPGVTQQAEAISGAAIRTAEYEEIWPCRFTSGHVLDVGQASEITEVACLDNVGAWQPTEMLARLDVGGRESRLIFPDGRPTGPLRIRYRAGLDLEQFPGVRLWLLMHAATAHEQRETLVVGLSLARLPGSFLDTLLAEITVPPRF